MTITRLMPRNLLRPGPAETAPGLYLHIPFCLSKCPYCSFCSRPCSPLPAPDDYLEAIRRHAALLVRDSWTGKQLFGSIYVGGGTPTIYAGPSLAGLLKYCRETFAFQPAPEISVECNPNTAAPQKLAALLEAGVNRLSIGVQSFSDRLLTLIGRNHSAEQARTAVAAARKAGFTNLSLDLIYGLPQQNLAEWQETVRTAIVLEPEHLSVYGLTIEDGTPFAARQAAGSLPLPPEEVVEEMDLAAQELLSAAGYRRYEISNYSRKDFECRHNINYWENGSYLGLGAGAVSCLAGVRLRNVEDPEQYGRLNAAQIPPYLEAECLPREASFRETVVMGLRMTDGISLRSLERRYGISVQEYYGKTLEALRREHLVEITTKRLRLTDKGLPIANLILSQLV